MLDITKELEVNEQIRDREVRLIGPDGEQIGVVDVRKAQKIAYEHDLDLVKVAPNAKPPVTRIMDYGKYRYEMNKKEREARKNQTVMNLKEVRMSPHIEEHDLNVRARQTIGFLKDGDKVKVSIRFRGRELGHKDLGREVLDDFTELIGDEGKIDKAPAMEGRNMVMFFVPNREK